MNPSRMLMLAAWLAFSLAASAAEAAPYPASEHFAGITFHQDTLVRAAEGSDIWNCTWANDGNLYATWGDGGGFGGTDTKGRASLGVARLSGSPPEWLGTNIWGGINPLSAQPPPQGKASMIAVGDALYLYASEQGAWDRCQLWKSLDSGKTWRDCGWLFPTSHKVFAFPGLVQFGQAHRLSADGYVYGFSDNDPKRVHDRRLYLFRVKPSQMETLAAYEYFSGTAAAPAWSHALADLQPVFANPAGISWGSTCVFHPATGRYLLSVGIDAEKGSWGLYESTQPWGPWHTIGYGADFPAWTCSPAEKKRPAYVHSFPGKWMSADGTSLWCIFDRGDHFNLVRCTLTLKAKGQP